MNKMLVIDDCPVQRTNLEAILIRAGYQVKTIDDGEKALDTAKSYVPDLIFMDVNMPGKDGFAATRDLKGDATVKDIPVVFVTSKGQKADVAWGKILGSKGHIMKPYDDSQILEVINSLK